MIATLARRGAERGLDVFDLHGRQGRPPAPRRPHPDLQPPQAGGPRRRRPQGRLGRPARPGRRPALADRRHRPTTSPASPGIGLKTGAKLIEEFGTLDNLLANVAKVSGAKRKENLTAFADVARRARQLITLRDDLPLDLDWDALRTSEPDVEGVQGPLHRVRLPPVPHRDRPRPGEAGRRVGRRLQDGRHARGVRSVPRPSSRPQPRFCFDTETTVGRPAPRRPRRALVLLEVGRGVLPARPRARAAAAVLDETATLDALRPVLANPETEKVGQNVKYDMLVLERAGLTVGGPVTDTMVLSYLLESGERNHNLDQLSQRLLDHAMVPITDLIGKGKNQLRMDQVDVAKVGVLRRRGRRRDLADRGDPRRPRPRGEPLAALRRPGTPADPRPRGDGAGRRQGRRGDARPALGASSPAGSRRSRRRSTSRPAAPFNIGSAPQLRQVLFEELKLPVAPEDPRRRAEHGAGGPRRTRGDAPPAPAPDPAPAAREAQEHVPRRPARAGPPRGRPGPRLVQPGGRGDRPAQFQRPEPAEHPGPDRGRPADPPGVRARRAGLAAADGRLLADRAARPRPLLERPRADAGLRRGPRHPHGRRRADLQGRPRTQVDGDDAAGGQDGQLRRRLRDQARSAWRPGWGSSRPRPRRSSTPISTSTPGSRRSSPGPSNRPSPTGRVETILGRRRPINGIKNTTGRDRNLAERTAVNTVIQGSAADLIKRAMLAVDRRHPRRGARGADAPPDPRRARLRVPGRGGRPRCPTSSARR